MFFHSLARDLRQAMHSLARSPVFTIISLVTLSLGIGLSTTSFCTIDTLVLRRLPFPKSEDLVCIFRASNQFTSFWHSPATFLDLRDSAKSFTGISTWNFTPLDLVMGNAPAERLTTLNVSPNFLSLLNIVPALGRDFLPEDEKSETSSVVIITHRFWRERFNCDPGILGKSLRLSRHEYEIVGVLPEKVNFPDSWARIDVLAPFLVHPNFHTTRDKRWLELIARLKPGVSKDQAQAELDLIAGRLAREHPEVGDVDGFKILDIQTAYWSTGSKVVLGLMIGLSLLVLLAACINLAGLQLVRCLARKRELAVRSALGASHWQTMSPLITESMVLSAGGCAGGLLVAQWANVLIGHFILFDPTRVLPIPVDYRALGISAIIALVSGLGFGLFPALIAERTRPIEVLNEGGRSGRETGTEGRMRRFIIVAEIAIALFLISISAVFASACASISKRNLGWDSEGLCHASFMLPWHIYMKDEAISRRFMETLETDLAAIPGVRQVAICFPSPVWGGWGQQNFTLEGAPPPPKGAEPLAESLTVSTHFFSTLKIPLLFGRSFDSVDHFGSPRVVMINQSMAKTLWPGQSAVGKCIRFQMQAEPVQIIGVVGDIQFATGYEKRATTFQIYSPLAQNAILAPALLLKTEGSPSSYIAQIKRLLAKMDPDLCLTQTGSVHSLMRSSNRFLDTIAGNLVAFAAISLLIAVIGIYGVIANLTALRMHSIAVRLALGADYGDIMRLILGHGSRLVLTGLLTGAIMTFLGVRLLEHYFPGMELPGLWIIAVTMLILASAGLLACWIPAHRATQIDPALALRAE